LSPVEAARMIAEVGAWGVNLHDNDLVPIDASPAERDRIVKEFKKACDESGIVVPMATVSLFYDPAFRDGAFTANDAAVRAYAVQKTMRAMDIGAELGAKIFVLWGGREGTETDACRRADVAVKRLREAIDYLCEYSNTRNYGYRFALEAKPNEPRGDIYMATTGNYLGLIPTLAHPDMVGVNPEVAHEQMAGLNFVHAVAQAWDAGKLFHIDLNDQAPGRYDQDFRFGAANPKSAFFLVKFLEDVGYDGPRHFDAHAYRTENYDGVKDFARGCMRTYLILKERAARWNADAEIQALLAEINEPSAQSPTVGAYATDHLARLLAHEFDRSALSAKRLPYERLDQLTIEVLLGVR
jgi:xylose isomerase